MKRALLHTLEPGRICDVVDTGAEFEVHPNFYWIDVPDDTTSSDRWDEETQTVKKWNPVTDPNFIENGYKVARGIMYGSLGDQLDMMYKEIQANGTLSPDGPWATHVANVKATLPKDDPQAIHDWNQAMVAASSSSGTP